MNLIAEYLTEIEALLAAFIYDLHEFCGDLLVNWSRNQKCWRIVLKPIDEIHFDAENVFSRPRKCVNRLVDILLMNASCYPFQSPLLHIRTPIVPTDVFCNNFKLLDIVKNMKGIGTILATVISVRGALDAWTHMVFGNNRGRTNENESRISNQLASSPENCFHKKKNKEEKDGYKVMIGKSSPVTSQTFDQWRTLCVVRSSTKRVYQFKAKIFTGRTWFQGITDRNKPMTPISEFIL